MKPNLIFRNGVVRMIIVTGLILLVPLIAMQFNDGVNWTALDFATAGILLLGAGFIYEFVVRPINNVRKRNVFAAVLVAAFLFIWAELAVGIFGD
ncbi:MAG TPA: hypothetical protein VG964_03635 [Candidatus Saccharimonadales bacterium]|nr:hypothetical protein [Candidatus Saccharimonadales bacterium]